MPLVRRLNKSTSALSSTATNIDNNSDKEVHADIAQLQCDLHHKELVIQELMRQIERLATAASPLLPASPTSTKESSPRGSLDGKSGGEGKMAWRRRTFSCVDALVGERRRSRLGSFIAKCNILDALYHLFSGFVIEKECHRATVALGRPR